ncbi:MAG: hypothetical protein ACM3JG_09350 [Thiohalocapsa sp.]
MAMIDDYAQIAAELRRIRAEHRTGQEAAQPPLAHDRAPQSLGRPPGHPMRRTLAGELLYRRLVSSRR